MQGLEHQDDTKARRLVWVKALRCLQVFLCSALTNLSDVDGPEFYPTALQPGGICISRQECRRRKRRAQHDLLPQHEEPQVSSARAGYNTRSISRPIGELHLTTRLAQNVFLGGCVLLSGTILSKACLTNCQQHQGCVLLRCSLDFSVNPPQDHP